MVLKIVKNSYDGYFKIFWQSRFQVKTKTCKVIAFWEIFDFHLKINSFWVLKNFATVILELCNKCVS